MKNRFPIHSKFDVGRSMFDVHISKQTYVVIEGRGIDQPFSFELLFPPSCTAVSPIERGPVQWKDGKPDCPLCF
jgi:hypothetical protein